MQGIRFAATFFVIVTTSLGAFVLPYGIVFLLRRRETIGCTQVLLYVVSGALFGLLIGLALRPQVEARLVLPLVQSALDAQCGGNAVIATLEGIEETPYTRWIGDNASCHYIDLSDEWECYCP